MNAQMVGDEAPVPTKSLPLQSIIAPRRIVPGGSKVHDVCPRWNASRKPVARGRYQWSSEPCSGTWPGERVRWEFEGASGADYDFTRNVRLE